MIGTGILAKEALNIQNGELSVSDFRKLRGAKGAHALILHSKWYPEYVKPMVEFASTVLKAAKFASVADVQLPGSLEMISAANQLCHRREPQFDVVLCLGVVIRGETDHYDVIKQSVATGLPQVAVKHNTHVLNEVLFVHDRSHADVRCGKTLENKGLEAAIAAIEVIKNLRQYT